METAVEILKIKYKSPEWYALRTEGIGGSDAAAVLGLSPWKKNTDVWKEKVGLTKSSIKTNKRMEEGSLAEEPITQLFAIEHADEYEVIDYKDTVFKRGHQIASVDGGLIEKATGRKGGLEVKHTEPNSRKAWDEWDDRVPMYYYCQVLHYLSTTGWDFFVLKARFKSYSYDEKGNKTLVITEREYKFEREEEEKEGNLAFLEKGESEFWKYVVAKREPPLKLPPL